MRECFLLLILLLALAVLAAFRDLGGARGTWPLYAVLGALLGYIVEASGLCFTTAMSEPFTIGTTTQLRSLLLGILTASLGISMLKYLSCGELDYLDVSGIGLPLMLGALLFGIGMVTAGACALGVCIRTAEGELRHFFTLAALIGGYALARMSYDAFWLSLTEHSIVVFLPDLRSWIFGIALHLLLCLLLYLLALRHERRHCGHILELGKADRGTARMGLLTAAILMGIFSALHVGLLHSGYTIIGAFAWIPGSCDAANIALLLGLGGIWLGALFAAFSSGRWRLLRPRSLRELLPTLIGGLLMGYGAGIAGGCNLSAFYNAAAGLSLSGWVYLLFLLLGVRLGVALLNLRFARKPQRSVS